MSFDRSCELAERRDDLDALSADAVADIRPTHRYTVANRDPRGVLEKAVDVFVYCIFRGDIDDAAAQFLHLAAKLTCKALARRPYGLRALEHGRLCVLPPG